MDLLISATTAAENNHALSENSSEFEFLISATTAAEKVHSIREDYRSVKSISVSSENPDSSLSFTQTPSKAVGMKRKLCSVNTPSKIIRVENELSNLNMDQPNDVFLSSNRGGSLVTFEVGVSPRGPGTASPAPTVQETLPLMVLTLLR